jgi:UDP-N-acetylglucosamine--N-acetylmuramyl-(pentapeptide) pyrophosphoryl-undecaprenol N-acetylglucosamine transferase
VRVAFAGGGTGGHIYPALGIDDALRAAAGSGAYERRFFGNRDGLEARVVTTMPLTFVPSAPLRREVSLRALRTFIRNVAGVAVAVRALLAYRPALLIATGGYVCFPVVVAARLLRTLGRLDVRIALLEINARPGLTNRLLTPLVDEVWITFAQSQEFFGAKARLTGAPVRASLVASIERAAARSALELAADRTTIVVMGGSQGARSINDAVVKMLAAGEFPPDWQILQISGERDYADLRARHATLPPPATARLVAYVADPANVYAAADIVVARAGASTLAELATTATPAILVPYPFAADDHQTANARLFASGGAAVVIADADLNPATLATALRACLQPERLRQMRAAAALLAPGGAAAKIVDRITALLGARVVDSSSPNEVARD